MNRVKLISILVITITLYVAYSILNMILTNSYCPTGSPSNDFCNCNRKPFIEKNDSLYSWDYPKSYCSSKASALGKGQNVVSYSLFVDRNQNSTYYQWRLKAYYDGIIENLNGIRKYYPHWIMRIYTIKEADWNNTLCDLECNNSDFFLCNADDLPVIGNVTNILYGPTWRFLPMGDPTVNMFISRDLDSEILAREKDAMLEWLSSNFTFHAMRDHIRHKTKILAGMWGAKNYMIDPRETQTFRNLLFKSNENRSMYKKGLDQIFLAKYIYPRIKSTMLVHDSYFCQFFNDSVPFPTKRKDKKFVGGFAKRPLRTHGVEECPVECRPTYGKNWTFC